MFWDSAPEKDIIAALGLYGDRLRVGYGSLGGWDSFGPARLITRSKGNVLYELDGKSALELYNPRDAQRDDRKETRQPQGEALPVHDAAHDAFMTLPAHTSSRENEV